jgi:hypothetical protein
MKEYEFLAMDVALDATFAALQRSPRPQDDDVCVHGVSLDEQCEECYKQSQGIPVE